MYVQVYAYCPLQGSNIKIKQFSLFFLCWHFGPFEISAPSTSYSENNFSSKNLMIIDSESPDIFYKGSLNAMRWSPGAMFTSKFTDILE